MAKVLELKFTNQEGKIVTISLNDPVEPVDGVAVASAMDQIIAQNVFFSSGGDFVAKQSARVVERNVTDILI
jgi:aromatic ring-opening dioxygenase catalytic subunit (LigB family)